MARILIIDDDVLLIRLLEQHLKSKGFEVASACYVGEGLEMAVAIMPDLIMLDLLLPDATGYQACGILRQHPQTKLIPIIMMTSAARLPSQHRIGRLMGADEYLVKPLDLIDVENKIQALLNEKRHAAEEPESPSTLEFVPSSGDLFDNSSK